MFLKLSSHIFILLMSFGISPVFAETTNKPNETEAPNDVSILSIRGSSLLGTQYYKIEAGGFSANSPASTSRGLAGEVLWQNDQDIYIFKVLELQSPVSSPNSLQPNEVTSTLKIFEFAINRNLQISNRHLSYFSDGLSWDLGLQWRERNSNATSPNRYLPHYQMLGVKAALNGQKSLSQMWTIEVGTGIFLPLYFDERSEKTGNFKFGLMPEMNINLVYKLNPSFDFSLGAKLLYEQLEYSGAGVRGTSDATERYTNLILPLELRFLF